MLRDWLHLRGSVVTVTRTLVTSTSDGELVSTSATVGIPNAAIWSPSQNKSFISDKMALISTHVLVTIPNEYAFTADDKTVTYNGVDYRIVGPSDNVMFLNEIMVTPLERVQ